MDRAGQTGAACQTSRFFLFTAVSTTIISIDFASCSNSATTIRTSWQGDLFSIFQRSLATRPASVEFSNYTHDGNKTLRFLGFSFLPNCKTNLNIAHRLGVSGAGRLPPRFSGPDPQAKFLGLGRRCSSRLGWRRGGRRGRSFDGEASAAEGDDLGEARSPAASSAPRRACSTIVIAFSGGPSLAMPAFPHRGGGRSDHGKGDFVFIETSPSSDGFHASRTFWPTG